MSSYDRLFPNQDTMPKGGFGNLIALPLQKGPRQRGHSMFVDEELKPHPNQWAYLASTQQLAKAELENAILRANGGHHPLDVSFAASEDESKPWQRSITEPVTISGPLPESLKLVLANQIFIGKENLTQPLINRLIRLAAFQNPEFFKSQAMRMPVWNKPRIICCAENFPKYLALPRGCLDSILATLKDNGIKPELQDERVPGQTIATRFTGKLRKDQQTAVQKTLQHEAGVLCAPTAFGKTVVAAKIIAKRKISTLILVHRTDLLRQWEERLSTFLDLSKDGLGAIGGGRKKLSGKIDIGVLQSLSRSEKLEDLLDNYGQIIVDECHHLSAFSFETIIKKAKARFILGLTATPVRRDGHQPIIYMQCGPIRHVATLIQSRPIRMEVCPRFLSAPLIQPNLPIQDTFRSLVSDSTRNQQIVEDALTSYQEGRKVLVLTERTDHLELLSKALEGKIENYFVLHGRLSKKRRAEVHAKLNALAGSTPRVLLATGRLVGEGFDHPPLDTLVLAMPISWKGTLQQYAGRLHREHTGKRYVRIYDYAELDNPQLARMWSKRLSGYVAMGYEVKES